MRNITRLTRRQFLVAAAAGLGGIVLSGMLRFLAKSAPQAGPDVFLPFVTNIGSNSFLGKVVHIHGAGATHWQGEQSWWNHINQDVVTNMLNQGIMTLTETSTVADAWHAILPNYQVGQKIAVKVNFNNCSNCSETDGQIDGLIEPINAVVSGLEQIGVARGDVCVYDAIRALPNRFVSRSLSGVSFYDGGCRNVAGFSYTPASRVEFFPPPGVTPPEVYVTNVLMNASYLINMPIMKGGHPIAGVTLGAKNHFGTIDQPGNVHQQVDIVSGSAREDYNPLIDFFRSDLIGGKTVLTVGDGVFAARQFNASPQTWTTFGNQVPNSLLFSKDMVAIDCVMHDLLAAELGTELPENSNNYLRLAGLQGLGVFECGDPWLLPYGSGYNNIQYIRVEV